MNPVNPAAVVAEPGYDLSRSAIRLVRPDEWQRRVRVYARAATPDELLAVVKLPNVVLTDEQRELARKVLGPLLIRIEGLTGTRGTPVETLEHVLAEPPFVFRLVKASVMAAAQLTDTELGESSPQPSGGATTAPGTAVIADGED